MDKKEIGPVTHSASNGAGVATAISVIVVWILNMFGIDVTVEVAGAMSVIFAYLGGLIGGYIGPNERSHKQHLAKKEKTND